MARSIAGPLLLCLVAAGLTACNRTADDSPAGQQAVRINLFGEVRTSDGHSLADDASIEVRLRPQHTDAPEADAVAVTTLSAVTRPPYPFSMVYSPAELEQGLHYVLDARAFTASGEVTHVTRTPVPLPAGEAAVPVDLQLSPVGPRGAAQAPVVTAYACDVAEVIVQSRGTNVAVFGATHAPLQLRRVPSASGTRYADEAGNLFWSHGQDARLEVSGQAHDCRENPSGSRMAAARMAGASVYAVGQEPGWFLTVVPDDRVTLVADYGSEVVVTPPAQARAVAGGWQYQAQTNSQHLRIEVSDNPCTDAMSGARWPRTVVVHLGDRELSGCGARWDTPREPAGRPG